MQEAWLQMNNTKYSVSQLKSGHFKKPLTQFERATLEFSHDWLAGKNVFTLQTSGSTGKPKTIILKRNQMEVSARNTIRALRLMKGDVALLCLDPRYIAGKMMLVRSFLTGMNIIVREPSANPLKTISPKTEIDFTAMVPYQLQAILKSPADKKKLNGLKALLIGGAETDSQLKVKLSALKLAVYATYGMTETISHIAVQKINEPGAQDYFQAMPGVALQKDRRGCLVIHAAYLGKRKIITNDLVDILTPKRFRWLGRWDNMINTGGVKVIPEKIEKEIGKQFRALGLTNRFFVTGLQDNQLGSKVALIVEGKLPPSLQSQLSKELNGSLSKFEIPKEIKSLPKFADTATQKIDRLTTIKNMKANRQ